MEYRIGEGCTMLVVSTAHHQVLGTWCVITSIRDWVCVFINRDQAEAMQQVVSQWVADSKTAWGRGRCLGWSQ